MTDSNIKPEHHHAPIKSVFLRAILTLFILGCAGALAFYFISNPKVSKKKEDVEKPVIYVETQNFQTGDYPIMIELMGQVTAAKEASLKAQISGKVLSVSNSFIPGGYFEEGQDILTIDPSDYELNIKVKQAALAQAQATMQLEKGQQAIAKDELKILERTTGRKLDNNALALRKPQMEQARANIAAAQADLDIAKLNLERTKLTAPFNAIVTARETDIGNIVSANEMLATLVGTDEYWIEGEIPAHQLHWLEFPTDKDAQGSPAQIHQSNTYGTRTGHLKTMAGTINAQSRLAKILVSVPDPLLHKDENKTAKSFILNLNDYVRVTLEGKTVKNILRLPQKILRENNTVWLYKDGILDIHPIKILFEDRNFAYIENIEGQNISIITSDIITPIQGMEISLRQADQTGESE